MLYSFLLSGGKDSCYNMMQCVAEGHEIVALANLRPEGKDELDSYMYQTVGHHAIDFYADAMGLPLYRRIIEGSSVAIEKDYHENPKDEVEDLYALLKYVKENIEFEAVASGAILSDYQRVRVENVCSRLGLTSLAYLWRRDQSELLREMIESGVEAILIKVAAMGLEPRKHLGKTIADIYPHMLKMETTYGLNVCGEGGEYETFTLNCPLFEKRILIGRTELVIHSDDAFAPVGFLNLKEVSLEDKPLVEPLSQRERLMGVPVTRSQDTISKVLESVDSEVTGASAVAEPSQCKTHTAPLPLTSTEETTPVCMKDAMGLFSVAGLVGVVSSMESTEEIVTRLMDKLKDVIENQAGAKLRDISFVHLYVSNMAEFARINSVYSTYFSLNPPARTCVQVALPESVVLQLDCTGSTSHEERHTMHVQGISHWAPANIGPYSQAVRVGNRITVAGQIPLVAGSMQLIGGGSACESALSLQHVQRVLSAMQSGATLRNIVSCVCYVTHEKFLDVAKQQWAQARHKQEDVEAASPLRACMMWVVVPGLPRGAGVEWEVTAITDTNGCKSTELVKRYGEFSVRSWSVHNEAGILAIKLNVESPLPAIGAAGALQALTSHIASVCVGCGRHGDGDTSGHVTVFYPTRLFGHAEMNGGVMCALFNGVFLILALCCQ
ncbi:PREDICTED: diphthine--ammonia ligase-like isoform X2 [Priapulus caudatus]|uniref:Diphthine--ammonia ligase n=1 Tax=Priapulus caudatus TaxID=37621 RepID=A0ABM1FBX1_PRICU|nr:PREDICTED: diphthine--ammonia ligase-like isoform X2 [Priapulus caudatus]